MNAKEAKALAEQHSKNKAVKRKLEEEKAVNVDTNLLYNHFCNKIDEAVTKGKLTTEAAGIKIEFPCDRFSDQVISDVVNKLRLDGYTVSKETHTAYQVVKFNISWI